MTMRIGNGYDVHRLTEGRRLILCGVDIPYEKGLLGHSDGDAPVHAIIDALLGAAGMDDIGTHFPDTDPAYLGADSVAQRPKLSPYFGQMKENLVRALKIGPDQANIKAKTEETLGFTGQGQGIKAYAVALIERMEPN